MMTTTEIRSQAETLRGVLNQIERGQLTQVTPAQRGFIAGAEQGLRCVLGEGSLTPPVWTAGDGTPVGLSATDDAEIDRLVALVSAPTAGAVTVSEIDRLAELGRS